MTRVTFQEKYYPAVKETLYQAKLENGLTVSLLPKNDFNGKELGCRFVHADISRLRRQ